MHSTPLERLSLDREGATFSLDGRPVRLQQAADPASFAAFQSLYQWALADFEARRKAEAKPGWIARLKSWVGRWLSGPSAAAPASPARPEAPPAPAPRPTVLPPVPSVSPANAKPVAGAQPEMRAVFGDRGGLRVIWEVPGKGKDRRDVECHYPLDSELAGRLQECYGHLDRLGYKVVGLDLKAGREAVEEKETVAPAPVKTPRPPRANPRPEKPAAEAQPPVLEEKKPRQPEIELSI